jgi:hypothetical protein
MDALEGCAPDVRGRRAKGTYLVVLPRLFAAVIPVLLCLLFIHIHSLFL